MFSPYKVLTFDCYGTLIDWERGLINSLKELRFPTDGQEGALLKAFSTIEPKIQSDHPKYLYPQVLEECVKLLGKDFLPNSEQMKPEEVEKFGASVANWPAFNDSPAALAYLQSQFKLVIISNIDRESFSKSEALLGVKFDLIITAQDCSSYKPDLNNFKVALSTIEEKWGYKKNQVLHVFQSLFHDAVPANEMEIATVHINRAPLSATGGATAAPTTKPHLDHIFATLGEFASAVQKEVDGK